MQQGPVYLHFQEGTHKFATLGSPHLQKVLRLGFNFLNDILKFILDAVLYFSCSEPTGMQGACFELKLLTKVKNHRKQSKNIFQHIPTFSSWRLYPRFRFRRIYRSQSFIIRVIISEKQLQIFDSNIEKKFDSIQELTKLAYKMKLTRPKFHFER